MNNYVKSVYIVGVILVIIGAAVGATIYWLASASYPWNLL